MTGNAPAAVVSVLMMPSPPLLPNRCLVLFGVHLSMAFEGVRVPTADACVRCCQHAIPIRGLTFLCRRSFDSCQRFPIMFPKMFLFLSLFDEDSCMLRHAQLSAFAHCTPAYPANNEAWGFEIAWCCRLGKWHGMPSCPVAIRAGAPKGIKGLVGVLGRERMLKLGMCMV